MEVQNKSAELFVSYDRNSVTLRLYADNIYDYYKDCRAEKKEFFGCDYVEMPIATVTPDGYYYAIRGKKSLKEFICGEESFDLKMLKDLLDLLSSAIKRAVEMNVQMSDIVFDYNCVFLQPSGKGFTFIYMPGATLASNAPTAGDLVNVLFFNMDKESIDDEFYEKLKESVSNVQNATQPIEISEKAMALGKDIETYILANQRFTEKLKKKLLPRSEKKEKRSQKHDDVTEFDRKIEIISDDKIVYEKFAKIGSDEKIRIGRDDSWADYPVGGAFSSRRHAEILISKEGLVSVLDYSLNGTYVDGERAYDSNSFETGDEGLKLRIGGGVEFVLKIERISA